MIELPLRRKGSIRDFKVGRAKGQLMKGLDIVNTTLALLNQEPEISRCTNPSCLFCPGREVVREGEQRTVVTGRIVGQP